jgi:glutamyl/glutaminyl-tRNA synthetase
MAITHVIRGEDHISNTPRQVLLYRAYGWTPPVFAHVPYVLGPDHAPLSKRHGATSVREFRDRGYLPEALTNYLALIGWSPGEGEELLPIDELAKRFRLENVGHSAGVFDVEKLAWVNRHYLKTADHRRLAELALPYLQQAGWIATATAGDMEFLTQVVPAAAASVDRLEQVPRRLAFLFDYSAQRSLEVQQIRDEARGARPVIEALAGELAASGPLLDRDSFRAAATRVREKTGQKGKALFHPIRLVLTGEAEGLELDLAVPAIERGAALEESGVRRIPSARERAAAFASALAS